MWDVRIVADSTNPDDCRLTTFVLTYPRFIHSEIMTHRVFSRNAASSRAIPIEKMIEAVLKEPAMPVRWGANGKGMQDHGELTPEQQADALYIWRDAANSAVINAQRMLHAGVHKQIVNRLLEPFMWMTTIITATQWHNFFRLRVHPAAQPELQFLAHKMLQTYLTHKPSSVYWAGWHFPFIATDSTLDLDERKISSVARCARVSYTNHEKDFTFEDDKRLHDHLLASGHMSPFEHVAQADAFRAFRQSANLSPGWIQYRKHVSKSDVPDNFDLAEHLKWYESQKTSS